MLADAALAHGGEVTCVIPRHLVDREVAHSGLSDLRIVDSMQFRGAIMDVLSSLTRSEPSAFAHSNCSIRPAAVGREVWKRDRGRSRLGRAGATTARIGLCPQC